ncbi:MAG TPA: DUF1648 domain-containing protein [Acidimicrobiia bacterium]
MALSENGSRPTSIGTRRLLLWSGLWLALCAGVLFIAWANLPSEVAIHWNGAGVADGSAPRWAVLAVAAAVIALGLLLSLQFRIGSEPSMEAFAIVGMLGALGLAITLLTVIANWGVAEWTGAAPLSIWAIVGLFVISLLGLLAGIVLGREWYPIRDLPMADGEDRLASEIGPGERVSWVGRVRVRWMALSFLGIGLFLLFAFPSIPLWVFLGVVGLGIVMSQVEANVTNDGLRVRLGGVPVRMIGVDEISSARSIELEPKEWGGWGWRVSPGASAIVLRRGEALEITFRNGRRFAMTVDDAATGAALLNGLIDLGV